MTSSRGDLKPKQTESGVLNAVCEYLAYHKYFFWRTNNVPIFDPVGMRRRAMPKYALKGVSDIIVLQRGRCYFIEVKTPTGVQSLEQKLFQRNVEAQGCEYHIVRSAEDLRIVGF